MSKVLQNTPTGRAGQAVEVTLLILLCCLGLALRVIVVLRPLDSLITVLADDMFYYLVLARNVVSGRGLTFDGSSLTTGFHPLYLLCLLPFSGLGDEWFLWASLLMLSVLNVATALPVFLVLRRRASVIAGLAGAALWLFHPLVVRSSMTGVECSLSTFLVAWCIYYRQRENFSPFGLSLLCFLAFLGRTDAILLFGAMAADMIAGRSERRRTSLFILPFLVLLLGWFLLLLGLSGSPMQASARAIALYLHAQYFQNVGGFSAAALAERLLLGGRVGLDKVTSFFFSWVAGAGFLLAMCFGIRRMSRILYLLLFDMLILGYYFLYLWHFQNWYMLPVYLTLAFLAPEACFHAFGVSANRGFTAVAKIILAACLVFMCLFARLDYAQFSSKGNYPYQVRLLQAALWMRENLAPDTRVGAFNAGIFGYFSRRHVVNLDGVMNNRALEALEEKNLGKLIEAEKIEYIADFGISIEEFSGLFGGLPWPVIEVKDFGGSWGGSNLRLFRINYGKE